MSFEISTITSNIKLDTTFNLINIGKYLDLNDNIIGIKYGNDIIRGIYSTSTNKQKSSFANQLNIIVLYLGNKVNVSLYQNGTLHFTGCKSINEDISITKYLISQLNNLNKHIKLEIYTDEFGVMYDNLNYIYSTSNNNNIIGSFNSDKPNIYTINNKLFTIDKSTKLFISTKYGIDRKRDLLDFSGKIVGYTRIKLHKNKRFFKNNSQLFFDESNLIYSGDVLIGELEYIYTCNKDLIIWSVPSTNKYNIDYHCVATNEPINVNNISISSNINNIHVHFDIGFKINLPKLYLLLLSKNYNCIYDPEIYSGVRFTFNSNNVYTGQCTCSGKCTCHKISFLIFQSGKIISSGFKNPDQLNNVFNNFKNLLTTIKSDIIS